MTCTTCGETPKNSSKDFTKAVVEINNPEKIVLFRKVVIPASMGGRDALPPAIGKYHNVLLEYEADGSLFLYSSDGIPTQLSTDVTDLQRQLDALGIEVDNERVERVAADEELSNAIEEEATNRQDADTALSNQITDLDDSLATVAKTGSYNDLSNKPTIGNGTLTVKRNGTNIGTFRANAATNTDINVSVPTKTSDLTNDGSDGSSQYAERDDLATVATSGSYNDLTNKPIIGNATLTIKRNNTNAGTFTANATTNKSINIAVPTKTSDLVNDGADGTSTYVESNDLPTVDTMYSSSSNNAIANSTVTNSLDRNVMTNLALDSTPSTTTVNLNNAKTNLAYPSSTTTSSISLPVASSTQAGVMNSATFDAVTNNTNNINAILNGAVAISNLPASPTQAQLTTAWENETGLTSIINRASVYDVTNNKVWTYYTNDQTWHAASNTSQITVNTFTNSSEGTIKGSTNDGQVFAENDGTGSVNGWDALTSTVSSNASKLATIAQGAEVNVQANWTQTNTTADDYIRNKPANLVQDANYVHTDNNFTTTLKNKLDGIESGAEVNVQADWAQTDTTADDYIKNKPTIPTVNNATLTIQKNGTNVQTFTANSSTNKTANITVPTAVSELTNDSGYATTTQLNSGLATKQDTLTAGNNIQINGNTISATDTTYTAGNAIDITNGEISADIYPADFFTAEDAVSDCGSDLSLDDTMASTLKSVELKGDTYQQTYSGFQLLQKQGLATPTTDTDFWNTVSNQTITALEDGWARFTSSSSSASKNFFFKRLDAFSWEVATTYTVICEIKNAPSDGKLTLSQPQNTADPFTTISVGAQADYQFNGTDHTVVFSGTTKSSLSSLGLRPFFNAAFTSGSSVELRLTIVAGDHTADYQNYIGDNWEPYMGGTPSPNPYYPQAVQTVTGEQTVTVTGKNLFDKVAEVATSPNYSLNPDGSITTNASNAQTGCRYMTLTMSPGTYTLSFRPYFRGVENPAIRFTIRNMDTSTDYIVKNINNPENGELQVNSFTVENTTSVGFCIIPQARLEYGQTFYFDDTQLEEGSTATAYQPYTSQTFTIDLGSNELCKIGDYHDYIYKSGDDWYVHKEIGKIIVDGSYGGYNSTFNWYYCSATQYGGDTPSSAAVCVGNLFRYIPFATFRTNASLDGVSVENGGIRLRNTACSSASDYQTWLSNNNLILYYQLATPTDIQIIDETLVRQLEALAEAKSYSGQTEILVTAAGNNLPATLCVEAYRKSLSGVIEAIDSACTCRKNLVVYLPNGMTTYTNDDAPLPLDEALEAFEQGRSIFFVDYNDAETGVYAVSAVNANDGIWTMKVERTGTNYLEKTGFWVVSSSSTDNWATVEFYSNINKEPTRLNMIVNASTWNMTSATGTFMISSSLASQVSMSMTAEITVASTDVYFTDALSPGTQITLASLWSRIANGEQFDISVPYGSISSRADISPILDNRGKYGMSICNYARLDNSEMSTYSYTDSSTDTQKTISSYNSNATVDVLPSAAYEHELMKMNAPFGISRISTDGSESDTYVFFTTIFGSGQTPDDA